MKEKLTEDLIKQTAKKIFFAKGQFNAKMHEIAKEAGINRALLHYYFRNRDNLFEVVLQEAMHESFVRMFEILSLNEPFETKVEKAIHHIVDCLADYPFMENFIISEINKDPGRGISLAPITTGKDFTKKFLREIQKYISENNLPFIKPEHWIVNMMSLCAYPSSTKPIIQNILDYDEEQYRSFVLSRKKILPRLILMK